MRIEWQPLTLYQKFEPVSILILTSLIAGVIALAIWEALQLLALAAAILSLGGVYWLVRGQDRRHRRTAASRPVIPAPSP